MKPNLIKTLVLCVFVAGCSPEPAGNQGAGNDARINPAAVSTVLVDPAWLAEQEGATDVVVLDLAANEEAYLEGHVPGARLVNWRVDISDPTRPETFSVLPREQFEGLMSGLGITGDTTIVLYDDASSRLAARMYWTLKYYGHDDIRLLDGGKGAWGRSGREFSSENAEGEATDYRVQRVNDRYLATIDFINENLRDPRFSMVDARSSEQYAGETAGSRFGGSGEHRNKGHIYGARNVVWSDNFNEDGTFKSLEDLRELYAPHGVTNDKTVVTYCNVGILGSSPWFVLSELLGYEDVRLYDASMTEWANDDENYMVMGKHCM